MSSKNPYEHVGNYDEEEDAQESPDADNNEILNE